MSKLIFGCGYLGLRVAQRWVAEGEPVFAVSRTQARGDELASFGIVPIVADVTRTLPTLPDVDGILWSVGFRPASESQSIHEVFVSGIGNALRALPATVNHLIYISTTGVYSQNGGEWVDEGSTCEPQRPGSIASYQAEQLIQSSSAYGKSIILRLAGLYGPGRIPRIKELQEGAPITSPSTGYLNLIHVDDAVAVTRRCFEYGLTPALFNVSDGNPVERGDYIREIASLLGAPVPRFAPPDPFSPTALRASADKRVSNQRLIEVLNIRLRYPSYREGLAAIL